MKINKCKCCNRFIFTPNIKQNKFNSFRQKLSHFIYPKNALVVQINDEINLINEIDLETTMVTLKIKNKNEKRS